MSANGQRYNVGGRDARPAVQDPPARPFRLQRRQDGGGPRILRRPAGLPSSDTLDFSRAPWYPKDHGARRRSGYFMRHGTDHHAFVLFPKPVMDHRADRKVEPERHDQPDHLAGRHPAEVVDGTTISRITSPHPARRPRHAGLQLAHLCLRSRRPHQRDLLRHRADRLGPAIEAARYVLPRLPAKSRDLPQMSEAAEMVEAQRQGIDIFSGHRPAAEPCRDYDVGGVLLPRPFKIIKIGPVRLFVDDVDKRRGLLHASTSALRVTEEVTYRGQRCVFLRCNTEHHIDRALSQGAARRARPQRAHDLHVVRHRGRQLRAVARRGRVPQGARRHVHRRMPPELYPGIDYAAFALDPDGHCIQLYY